MNDLPFPDRPPLRYIDKQFRPDFFKLSKRYTLALLVHFGFALTFAIRSNECIHDSNDDAEKQHARMMNIWFLLAYFLVQIPAGVISYKYSATRLFGLCILVSSIISLLTPPINSWYKPAIEITAFLQGIVQGAANPAFYSIWRYWAPPLERSTLLTLGYSGTFSGIVIGYQLSESSCSVFHWDKILYLYGFVGICWYFLWLWLVFEHPTQHPTITDNEYLYLRQTIDITTEKPPIPWKQLFTSMPVWALLVCSFCRAWSNVEAQHSRYSQVMYPYKIGLGVHIDVYNLIMAISTILAGYIADLVLTKTTISTTKLRKLCISGSFLLSVLFSVLGVLSASLNYMYVSTIMYVVLLTVYCVSLAGFYANHLDIASRYAGITMCIANALSTVAAYLPYELDWNIFDFMNHRPFAYVSTISLMYVVGAIFYGFYGSGEQQAWAKPKKKEEEEDHETSENITARYNLNATETIVE